MSSLRKRGSSDLLSTVIAVLRFVLILTAVLETNTTSKEDADEKNAFEHDGPLAFSVPLTPGMFENMIDHHSMMMPMGFHPHSFLPSMMMPPFPFMGIPLPVPPVTHQTSPVAVPGSASSMAVAAAVSPGDRMIRHPHNHGGMGFSHPYPSPVHGMYDPLMDPGMVGQGNSFPGIPLKDSPKCRVTCDRVCDPVTGCTSKCMRQCCTFEKISTPLQSDLPQHPTGVNVPPSYDEVHPQFDPHHVPLHGLHGPHPHLHGAFHGFPVVARKSDSNNQENE